MADDPQDRLRQFSFQVFSKLEGAFTAGMIHLGDRLGPLPGDGRGRRLDDES